MTPPVDPGATAVVATAAVPPYYDDEDDEEPKKSSKLFLVSLIALLLLLAGMLFLLARSLGLGEDDEPTATQVEVPLVIGKTVGEATTILEAQGFEVSVTEEPNEDEPAGNVFAQDPARGTKVDEGSEVRLKVSTGAEAVRVPDVTGSQFDQARLLLEAQGFRVVRTDVDDEDKPVGEVVDQEPGPDAEAPKGSEVTLFVSAGPADRPVPDVVGLTVTEASNRLGQAGFTVTQTSESSDTVDAGLVIRTDPTAGTNRPKDTAVTIVVSTGPAQSEVQSYVGLTEANAINRIRNDGFTPEVVEQETSDQSQDGRVIDQDPGPGTMADSGSQVTITVGRYVAPVDGGTP